jgi:hypothetical protein
MLVFQVILWRASRTRQEGLPTAFLLCVGVRHSANSWMEGKLKLFFFALTNYQTVALSRMIFTPFPPSLLYLLTIHKMHGDASF